MSPRHQFNIRERIDLIKKFMLFLFIFGIIATIYFFRPLNVENVFPEWDNVEKISFLTWMEVGKDAEFKDFEIKEKELDYFKNLLELRKFRRTFGAKNIQSQTTSYDILIVHKSSNYNIIIINDRGYVVVEERNSKKKFKILSSKNDALIKLIDEMSFGK